MEISNSSFLTSPSSTPPLCVDAQKVELQGSQPGESQVTQYKETRLHDHPALAASLESSYHPWLAHSFPFMPIRSRKPIPYYTAHLYPADNIFFVTQHEDTPIHACTSFNVENVHGDAFNTRNMLRSL
jgi:hypothetical protein